MTALVTDPYFVFQSSNDTFPTAMHIAVAMELNNRLLPALTVFQKALQDKVMTILILIPVDCYYVPGILDL